MKLQDYDISQQVKALVVSSRQIAPSDSPAEVRELILEVDQPGFAIEVGQNIGVLAPGQKEFGQEHHFRLYSIADVPERQNNGHLRLPIAVRRCSYVDEYSGEEYKGVASNYLCDLHAGDNITITGPYGLAFEAPDDPEAALILIGAGTGIAPFRAFVKNLFQEHSEFTGRIFLFHGGQTGLDLLYQNENQNDFALYYDRDTFKAVAALSDRPHWTGKIDWAGAIESRGEEIWELLNNPHTQVYVAGLKIILDELDAVFAKIAGSAEKWSRRKAELVAGKRWIELVY